MLIALLLWLFQTALFLLYGRLALRLLRRLVTPGSVPKTSPLLTLLAGLVLVTTLASALSLWLNLGALTLALITLGGLLILLWEWRRDRLASLNQLLRPPSAGKGWLLIALALLALTLDLSTRTPSNPDTGIYHAQAIRWIETYPAVPGLGNLHTRFAYNSAWLTLTAQFSLAFTGIQSFHTLPGWLLALFSLSALGAIRRIFYKTAQPSHLFKAALLPLVFFTSAAESASPGTDFPAILLLYLLLAEWLAEREQPGADVFRPLLLGLSANFAVTIKLSVAPVVLLAVFIFLRMLRARLWRQAAALALGAVLILAPWCARNVVLSGYLVYPLPEVDLFSVDWKVPREVAEYERTVIQSWARIPREDSASVQAKPLAVWAKIWYLNQSKSEQALLWGAGLAPLGWAAALALSRRARARLLPELRQYGLALLIAWAGLLYWFVSAPDMRFGIGFVLSGFLLGWQPWRACLPPRLAGGGKWLAVVILLATLLCWGLLYRTSDPRNILQRLVLPKDYTSLSTAPCALKNKTILCAEWYGECGYAAFPCIPGANPEVGLRGASFREGFRYFGP